MMRKADPDYDKKSDIKWNFTKSLIDRNGNVVKRFEPTAEKEEMAPEIEKLLK
jgi:glutathione peroxidase